MIKAILSKKSNTGGITIPDCKLYIRVIAIKKKSIVLAQWNKIEDPDINPHSYSHMVFDKVTQNI
jgi:hypothetical protein